MDLSVKLMGSKDHTWFRDLS